MIAAVVASAIALSAPAAVADVQLAAQHLREDHANLFHDPTPERFDAAVAQLGARAGTLTDDQLLVGLMRLAALPGVRDGHTGIFPLNQANERTLHAYPIRLYTFSDGTYVVAQAAGTQLLRARLVAVNGRPLDEVMAAVRPLVPHDNGSTLGLRVTPFLNTPEVLHGLGLVPDLGPVTLTFERDGARFDAQLTLGSTWATSRKVLRAAKSKRLRAVVVDLRLNGGGDNLTYAALLDALRRVSKSKRIVVLLSRVTFSAAENFATEVERVAHPVFVGEPSGGSPNLYGDTVNTELPAAGVELRVAGVYWQMSAADDPRLAIDPRVPVPLSSADFFAGRDPVLAAALAVALAPKPLAVRPKFSYDKRRPLALRLGSAQTQNGVVRQSLSFDAGHGRKAAFWTHPEGTGPWPVVLFSPGSDGTVRSQLPDADRLARRGIASLTVAPPSLPISCRAAADVRTYVNYVVGRRRALDLLPKLRGADTHRVAAVGFSLGAAVTATLAGVDHRLRGAAIQSSRAHLSTVLGDYCHSATYRRAYSVLDPVHYVSRAAPAALLFQNGRRDPISPEADVDALVRAANGVKEQRWYDAPHELNDQARADLDEWLVKLLG